MARLEAQKKLLYYPTDLDTVQKIASHFSAQPDQRTRCVDPCCGAGDALNRFVDQFNQKPETLGIELSYRRSDAAKKLLDKVLPGNFYIINRNSTWTPKSVSLAFNNPPYDWSSITEKRNFKEVHIRHEILFIEGTTPKIVPGGHHIVIIPRGLLGRTDMTGGGNELRIARHLLGWFEDVNVYYDDNEDWKKFSQVIVIAANRREKYKISTNEEIERISQYANDEVEIPLLPEGTGEYVLPEVPEEYKFTYKPIDPKDLVRIAKVNSPVTGDEYQRLMYVRPVGASFTPAMPLKLGHTTMLVSGEETGILKLNGDNGKFIVKGVSKKRANISSEDNENEDGRYTSTSVKATEYHVTKITTINDLGEIDSVDDPKAVGDFITKYAAVIADAILEKNKPLYDFDPEQWAMDKLARVAVGLPPLPGRKERGLFLTQKHFAIAAYETILKRKTAIIMAEMGFGKTSTTVGVMTLLNQWPALVIGPGHMVYKWSRDIQASCDPKKPITARVISRPNLDSYTIKLSDEEKPTKNMYPIGNNIYIANAPPWLFLRDEIDKAGGNLKENVRYQVLPVFETDSGQRRKLVIECVTLQALIDIKTLLEKQIFRSKGKSVETEIKVEGLTITAVIYDRDYYTLEDFYQDYKSGKLGERAVAICGFDQAKFDSGWDTVPATVIRKDRVTLGPDYGYEEAIVDTYRCSNCGHDLGETVPTPRTLLRCPVCNSPLFSFSRWRRVGLAKLIQKKYRHFFKFLITDEVHKTKSGDTDIGVADQRMMSAIKYSLSLTGTLFGGTAGSIFYLLYRRVPEVRKLFSYDEFERWVDNYGLWETSWSQNERVSDDIGVSTGIPRYKVRKKEMPGVSPGVIRYLLPITMFGNITDLGYKLPALYEDVITLDMGSNLEDHYKDVNEDLLSTALSFAKVGDPGLLSVWFSTVRFRPASAFRNEVINYINEKKGTSYSKKLPAVITSREPWLPKEIELANIVRENMKLNRRTLVFAEQTGTRDITDRIKNAISTLVPKGEVKLVTVDSLAAKQMKNAQRELWIKHQAPLMNAFIVNPKLVETGLDLIMFSDLVFYETTLSLYVMWQSMRRVWRLGQDKEVRVKFLAYSGTIEEMILARMGKKMKYAQLLYGENASGILVENTDEENSDIQNEIIRNALKGKTFESIGEKVKSIFGNGSEKNMRYTTEPQGSVIAVSPIVNVVDLPSGEVTQAFLFPGFEDYVPKRRSKKGLTPGAQISLFG